MPPGVPRSQRVAPGEPFHAAWFARNRHLQTLWGKLFRSTPGLRLRTELWQMPDGDHVELHRVPAPAGSPRLLLLHGLEGGPQSHYAPWILARAAARGWGADLLVFRSCGQAPNEARRFYHSGETGDLATVLHRLMEEDPASPIGIVGVSLGGNVLLKLLGELGDSAPTAIRAAVTISVPFDLGLSADQIGRGLARIYERHFLRSLQRKVARKLERYPDLCDGDRVAVARSLRDFDGALTAPLHGFASANDYYRQSSSLQFLPAIRRPTLLINATDDPFLPASVLDMVRVVVAGNSLLELEFSRHGGHGGFIAGRLPWRPEYHAERRAVEFLASGGLGG